jgi:putative modified peptide
MADTILNRDQSIVLLTKLSSDDGFRSRYERNPAAALAEFVPADLLAQVPPENLKPVTLASKELFADALKQLRIDSAEVSLCKQAPTIRLNLGR